MIPHGFYSLRDNLLRVRKGVSAMSRARKVLWAGLAGVMLFALLLPAMRLDITGLLPKAESEQAAPSWTYERAALRWRWLGPHRVEVTDLTVRTDEGRLDFDHLEFQIAWASLWEGRPVIKGVTIHGAELELAASNMPGISSSGDAATVQASLENIVDSTSWRSALRRTLAEAQQSLQSWIPDSVVLQENADFNFAHTTMVLDTQWGRLRADNAGIQLAYEDQALHLRLEGAVRVDMEGLRLQSPDLELRLTDNTAGVHLEIAVPLVDIHAAGHPPLKLKDTRALFSQKAESLDSQITAVLHDNTTVLSSLDVALTHTLEHNTFKAQLNTPAVLVRLWPKLEALWDGALFASLPQALVDSFEAITVLELHGDLPTTTTVHNWHPLWFQAHIGDTSNAGARAFVLSSHGQYHLPSRQMRASMEVADLDLGMALERTRVLRTLLAPAVQSVEGRARLDSQVRLTWAPLKVRGHISAHIHDDLSIHMPGYWQQSHVIPQGTALANYNWTEGEGLNFFGRWEGNFNGLDAGSQFSYRQSGGQAGVVINGDVSALGLQDFHRLCPGRIYPNTCGWFQSHLTRGWFSDLKVSFHHPLGEEEGHVSLALNFAGASLEHFEDIPEVHEIRGRVSMNGDELVVLSEHAQTRGEDGTLTVQSGRFTFSDLTADHVPLVVELQSRAPIGRIVDVAGVHGIDINDYAPAPLVFEAGTANISGRAETTLRSDGKAAPISFSTWGEVEGIELHSPTVDALFDGHVMSFHEGSFTFDISSKTGIRFAGKGLLSDSPVSFAWWSRNLQPGADGRLSVTLTSHDSLHRRINPEMGRHVAGTVHNTLRVRKHQGQVFASLQSDTHDAAIDIPALGYTKARGIAGGLKLDAEFSRSDKLVISRLDVQAFDENALGLQVKSHGVVDIDTLALERFTIDELTSRDSRMQMQAKVKKVDAGYALRVAGSSFDAAYVMERLRQSFGSDEGMLAELGSFDISVHLDRVWLDQEQSVKNVRLGMKTRPGLGIDRLMLRSGTGVSRLRPDTVRVDYQPRMEDARRLGGHDLEIYVGSLDSALRLLGVAERPALEGGRLTIDGHSAGDEAPLSGKIRVEEFSVSLEETAGDVVRFEYVNGDFDYTDGAVTLRPLVAMSGGHEVKMTGVVRSRDDTLFLDMEGTTILASRLNRLIDFFPFGSILTGGTGDGILTQTFTLKGPLESLLVEDQ